MNIIEDMNNKEKERLFFELHPGFFDREYVRRIPENETATELMMYLADFDPECYNKTLPENITFGFYNGDINELKEKVRSVVEHWTQFFNEKTLVYCGYLDGKVASFCIIEDYGEHEVNGSKARIGAPGCVGTLEEYRNRGIGLTMIRNVTQILKEEGYEYSYIHYTFEPQWYSKAGYKTFVRWNCKGFIN